MAKTRLRKADETATEIENKKEQKVICENTNKETGAKKQDKKEDKNQVKKSNTRQREVNKKDEKIGTSKKKKQKTNTHLAKEEVDKKKVDNSKNSQTRKRESNETTKIETNTKRQKTNEHPENKKEKKDTHEKEKSVDKEKKSWEMNTTEKIESMMKKKNKGNSFFSKKEYSDSTTWYSKALDLFNESDEKKLSDDEKKKVYAIQLACHSNTALCKLKEKKYVDAIMSCNKALAIQKDHVKSLYRRAQAHAHNGSDDLALKDLKLAKKIQPDDKVIQKLFDIIRKRVRKQNRKEKKLYAGIFEKATFTPDKPNPNEKKDQKTEVTPDKPNPNEKKDQKTEVKKKEKQTKKIKN